MITYSGGSGESRETAVVIEGAAGEREGIRAEYEWLSTRFGERGTDWKLVRQSLQFVKDQGPAGDTVPRHLDVMEIVTAAGEEKIIYFNITGFFGRMDHQA